VTTILQTTPDTRAGIRNPEMLERSRRHAVLMAQACEQYRGGDVVVLDLTNITPVFDFFVIASANSNRQMRAIAEGVDNVMAEHGSARRGVEGFEGNWICQDYGDVVLHVFTPAAREHYDLEHLWGDAPRVSWETEVPEPVVSE
jgi:ribosome-associated protein